MFDEDLNNSRYNARDEEAQIRAVRLSALCRVYEQADRVLSGDPVIVNVMTSGPAPAWSDGQAIYLNAEEIDEIDLETLTQINGLNYHELAHHLYTPRRGTELIKWVMENDYMQSANMLEDQRIETLLTARYPSIAPYLTATVARWLSGTPDEAQANYMLVRGRRYLPLEIREGFRDLFFKPELVPVIADIVDEYRLLAFPRDYSRAKVLIKRWNDEVLANLDLPELPKGPGGCTNRDPIVKGRPEPGKAQEKDAKRGQGMGKAESTQVSRKPAEPGEQQDKDTSKQDGPQYVPQSAQEALDLREAQQQSQQPPSNEPGKGHHDSKGGIPESLRQVLDKTVDDVLERKDVQQDVKAKQKVIVGGDGKHDDALHSGKYDLTDVPQDAISTYRRFARELERLRDECEPTWHRQQASGKLNVQRVIRGCEIDEAFDRWDEGTDGADVEAVILVDRSGSMSSNNNDANASIACWTIKRSLEQIGAPVTVYAFDDQAEVAYKRNEATNATRYKFIYGNGGTDPYSSLLSAEQLLMASRKKNKMLFIVTDGCFNADKNDEVIERIAKRGVLTVMTLIMNSTELQYYENRGQTEDSFRHGAEIFGNINNAQDLLPFARQVVSGAIRKRGR